MGRTACTEPQCLYKCALYLFYFHQVPLNLFLWKPPFCVYYQISHPYTVDQSHHSSVSLLTLHRGPQFAKEFAWENLTQEYRTAQNVIKNHWRIVVRTLTTAHKDLNNLNAELNPICHLLALLGAHHILHVSRVRVNLMKVIYIY